MRDEPRQGLGDPRGEHRSNPRAGRTTAAPTTLRTRVAAAFLLLTLLVCGAFAVAAVRIASSIEDCLVDQRLDRTADELVAREKQGLEADLPPSVTLYRGDAIPQALRGLA